MSAKPRAVKRRRRYDATRRRARAVVTEQAIVDAAGRLFARDGFQATTVAAVAAAAHVSEETVYKRFRGKAGLVRAIRDRALAGEGATHAERRSDALHEDEPDPRRVIEGWSRLAIEVAPRVMPILQLVAAGAAGDPELAALQKELDAARLARMRSNARRLARAGHLRPGMRAAEAGDLLWACSSPELYDLLVARAGWPLDRYARLIADVMIAGLLPFRDHREPRRPGNLQRRR